MITKSVDYNLELGKILNAAPANQTLRNNFDREQEMTFTFSENVTETSLSEYTTGLTVSVETEFSGMFVHFLYVRLSEPNGSIDAYLSCSHLCCAIINESPRSNPPLSTVGFPFVSEGKICVSTTLKNKWTFGVENTFLKTYTTYFPSLLFSLIIHLWKS